MWCCAVIWELASGTGKDELHLTMVAGNGKSKIQQLLSPTAEAGCLSWPSVCISWNPEEADSNASEGMGVLAGRGQAGKEYNPSLPPLFLHRLPGEGGAQIEGVPSGLCPPASRSRLKHAIFLAQNPDSKGALHFCIVVHPRYSQFDKQE